MFFFYIFPRTSPFSPAWVFQPSSGGPTASWKHRDIFPQFFRKLQIEKSQQKHPRKINGWVPCPHGGLVQIMNSFLSTWVMEPVGEPGREPSSRVKLGGTELFLPPRTKWIHSTKNTQGFLVILLFFRPEMLGSTLANLKYQANFVKEKKTMKKWSLVR